MSNIILAILLTIAAQAFAWLQSNSQFIWEYWKDKPFVSSVVYGIPSSILFWYATNYSYKHFGALWNTRFLVFGLSYVTFPLMTYMLAGESVFTAKTLTCIGLSFFILFLQFYWK
jgi:hypothetical protein